MNGALFNDTLCAIAAGTLSGLFTSGVSYGIMKTKIERLEKDIEKTDGKFVSMEVFNARIEPIKSDLHEIKRDIKQLIVEIKK